MSRSPLSPLTGQRLQDVREQVDDLAFSGHEGALVIATVVGRAVAETSNQEEETQ